MMMRSCDGMERMTRKKKEKKKKKEKEKEWRRVRADRRR